jgi:tetratricopeptide (TPR) repeat protein
LSACCCSAFSATDIVSDLPEQNTVIDQQLTLSEDSRKKSEALSHFAFAVLVTKSNQKLTDEAIQHFLLSLSNNPTALEPLQLLLLHWKKHGTSTEAADLLLPVALKNPDSFEINIITSSFLAKAGRKKEAEELLQNSINRTWTTINDQNKSKYIKAITLLSKLYLSEMKLAEADSIFEKALDNPELGHDPLLLKEAADFYLRAAAVSKDDDAWFWFSLSTSKKYQAKMDKCLAAFEKNYDKEFIPVSELKSIIAIYSSQKKYLELRKILLNNLLYKPDDIESLVFLALSYFDCHEYLNASRIWKKVFARNGLKPYFYLEMGRAAMKSENYKDAIKAFEWFMISNPQNNKVKYLLALCYFDTGKYYKAISNLQKIPATPSTLYLISMAYMRLEEYSKALAAVEEAEKIAAETKSEEFLSKGFYLNMAFLYEKTDQIDKMEKVLKNLLKKEPDDPEVCNFLGYVWAERKMNLDEAEKLVGKALKSNPKNSAFLDSMAWIKYQKGDYKEALKYMTESLKYEGDFPDAVIADHAGDIYAALGKKDEALKYWKIAFETYSEEADPEKIKAKINKLTNE